jgi:hypothetical protein
MRLQGDNELKEQEMEYLKNEMIAKEQEFKKQLEERENQFRLDE